MDSFLTNMHLLSSQDCNWWTGGVWITVVLSAVWTLKIISNDLSLKVSQKSFGTMFMDRWDKDEPLTKRWESKNVEKKGNRKRSQSYSLLCKAWWRWCRGMGMHDCLWNRPSQLTDDFMYDDSRRMNLEGYKTTLPTNSQEKSTRFIGKCFILHQDNDPNEL